MANSKSAKKYILVTQRNHARSVAGKSKMKTAIKRAITAIEQKSENLQEVVREALRTIDKTASKGIIKKNTAARKKSRLASRFNQHLAGQKTA